LHLVAGILLILFDQISKWWVQSTLLPGHSLPVLPPWFFITHVQNPGAAFGLMANRTPLIIVVSLGVVIAAWVKRKQIARQPRTLRWGITLSLSGAIGNLIDRIRVGQVIDFLDLRIWLWVFNVADICIVVGVTLLIWSLYRLPIPKVSTSE
jgi:signal peptidase II